MSKRFFGIPAFYNYAMADGIYNCHYSNKYGIEYITKKIPEMPKISWNCFLNNFEETQERKSVYLKRRY